MYSMSWQERAFHEAAMEAGREEAQKSTALDMLQNKMEPEKIMKYTKPSPECIAELAKTL